MWLELGLLVVTLVVGYFTRPKQQFETPKPGKIEAKAIATAGAEIPVLFGSRKITGQNIVWWGHTKTSSIRSSGGGKK